MALDILTKFQAVQAERCQLYSQLSSGFKQYLQNKQEAGYQALMSCVTQGFAGCSQQVRDLESQLVQASRTDLAAVLRQVQDAEREKLHVTVSLQALRTALALREERKQQLKEFSDQHARPTGKAVDHVHSHTCGCGHGDEDDDDDGLGNSSKTASDEDIEAAIKEALQRLDGCVQTINDALEDVRYAVEDLREEQESCMMES